MKKYIVLFIFIILFLVSPDSYTHDLFNRTDTAWFFMCGKAWMNGMIPYIDFADSKGPLLWLIYGLGYLLSPYNYIGVFWISFIMYALVYIYILKLAAIFINNKRLVLLCPILLTLSLFNPWFHFEIRAEDWCQLFIILSLYEACKMLYVINECHNYLKSFFIFGCCFAATLLIKFNIAIMLAGIIAYCLFYVIRNDLGFFKMSIALIAGGAFVITPFMVTFIYQDNLNSFITEYFINTLKTVQNSNTINEYIHEWLFTIANPARMLLFSLSILGAIIIASKVNKDKFFFLFSFLCFYAIAIHHAFVNYYLCICLLFPIWFIITILKKYEHIILNKRLVVSITCAVIFLVTLANYTFTDGYVISNLFFTGNQYRKDYYNVGYLMSQIKNPRIIYYRSSEHGYGTPVNALPGSKYWSSQIGATPQMDKQQTIDVISGQADFIFIDDADSPIKEKIVILHESGYHECYHYKTWVHTFKLYTKHNLKPIPSDLQISNLDILFKRKIFNI